MDDFLDLLACPVCRGPLHYEPLGSAHGWLTCPACVRLTPVVHGMALFTESRQDGVPRPDIAALADDLCGDRQAYADYIEDKRTRGIVDAYAAFAPFNEAMRCVPPVARAAGESMRAGDAVLDLGNRVGWSGAMLAGLLPRLRVVSVCWSGGGVLGYRGFRHWFTGANRVANLCIVFSPMDAPLPVRQGAFALVHCHDSLHRQSSPTLLDETLESAAPDATVVHTHVHLADAEPEPYFERGGILRMASDYRDVLSRRLTSDPRQFVVAREAALFEGIDAGELRWDAAQDAPGYNGCIVIAPPGVLQRARRRDVLWPDPAQGDRLLANPLLRINPLTGIVQVDAAALGRRATEMLERHPPFAAMLRSRLPPALDASSIDLLRRAHSGATLADAARALGWSQDALWPRVAALARQGLVVVAPCAGAYHALHRFHANDRTMLDPDLGRALAEWAGDDPDAVGGLLFGGEVRRREVVPVVAALGNYLHDNGVGRGDPVGFTASGADALWLLMACLWVGARPRVHPGSEVDLVVVDRPWHRWRRELCLGGERAPITLARVLSAYLDGERPMSGDPERIDVAPEQHSMDWIGVDERGRLRLRVPLGAAMPGT